MLFRPREKEKEILVVLTKEPLSHLRDDGGVTPRQVKAGRILFLCTALLLHIARTEAQIHGVVDHPTVFVGGDAPPDAVVRRLIEGGVWLITLGRKHPGSALFQAAI